MSLHVKNSFKDNHPLRRTISPTPTGTHLCLFLTLTGRTRTAGKALSSPFVPVHNCRRQAGHTLRNASTRHAVVAGTLRLEVRGDSALGGTEETEAPIRAASVLQSELKVSPTSWGWRAVCSWGHRSLTCARSRISDILHPGKCQLWERQQGAVARAQPRSCYPT